MNKRISEIFDYGDEIVIAERDGSCDPAEIKELTMRKIYEEGISNTGKTTGVKKGRRAYRTALIAAAAALLLAGTAFAAYQYSIREALIGASYQVTPNELPDTQWEQTDLSLNGLADSPEYQAYAEWTAWNEAWLANDPWAERGLDDSWYETPDNYAWFYDAYFTEQAEKLDEIVEKYGLTLHTQRAGFYTEEELCAVLGVSEIWSGEHELIDGYVYNDGAFKLESLMSGEQEVYADMWLNVDGSFTMVSDAIAAGYDEWSYVTADGVQVALAMADVSYDGPMFTFLKNAWLIARLGEATVEVSFSHIGTREELEAYADRINFAELAEVFSTGADRSGIPAAVEAQAEAYQVELARLRQEQEQLEQAMREEEEQYLAQHTEEERLAIFQEELGDYAPSQVLEGYSFAGCHVTDGYVEPLWFREIRYAYEDSGGEAHYVFSYERYWSDEEHTESATRQEAERMSAYWGAESVGGYDGYVVWSPGGVPGLYWYDESRDLIFGFYDLHAPDDDGILTLEQLLDLAESFIESIDG